MLNPRNGLNCDFYSEDLPRGSRWWTDCERSQFSRQATIIMHHFTIAAPYNRLFHSPIN